MGGDYSKQAFKARKHFSDVLMQQGKIQLDSDWNEQAAIQFRRKRVQTIDTIGRAVVPRETKDGFKITGDGSGNILIHPGRMYVDGLLAENHGRLYADDGTPFERVFDAKLDEEKTDEPFPYSSQPYFIINEDEEEQPPTPYLVYLDVWQREVTHLKAPEIIEKAVGVDTTTRMQTVWQVRTKAVTSVTDPECKDALTEWDEVMVPSAGRLSTDTLAVSTDPDPCRIPPGGGYRGLENRLYRVEIHEGDSLGTATFKWARHNAAVATTITEIDGVEVTVVQSQWDTQRRFEIGDWVEVTDDKREFAGEPGVMVKVDDVDYATNTITLSSALDTSAAGDFPVTGKKPDATRHTRIRKWDQSGIVRDIDGTELVNLTNISSNGLIPVHDTAKPIVLEDGITVSFSLDPATGKFKTCDYWLFAARTDDASVEKLVEVPPEGIHHHFAKLAIVTGTVIEDCRILWPPELHDQSCCTVTVGDDIQSFGDYQSIQDAVESLPTDSGGKVCVLPGKYQENIKINNRSNIIIEGCGKRTRVISGMPAEEFGISEPVFHVTDSRAVKLLSMKIEAGDNGIGILVEESKPNKVQDISLSRLHLQAASRSAIEVRLGSDIVIDNNYINMLDQATDWPAIFLAAERALIKENSIIVEPGQAANDAMTPLFGRGGIQVGGTSENVRVIDNLIQGGIGNGITLGSLTTTEAVGGANGKQWLGWVKDPNTGKYQSLDTLKDIQIERNRIFDMGMNGIGVAAFFNLDVVDELISIEGLKICANEIRGCLNQQLPPIDKDMATSMGYGGIALADVEMLSILHNIIEDNGMHRHHEPVCGIFIFHAEGAEISDNRINNNGLRIQEKSSPGPRSGIHVEFAVAPTVGIWDDKFPRQNGVPAVTVHNNIVVQPLGKALSMIALGAVSITDNRFTSRGMISNPDSLFSRISTVSIVNLGFSDEFYLQQLMTFLAISRGKSSYDPMNAMHMAGEKDLDDRVIGRSLTSGNVLFNDNQCVCDLLGTTLSKLVFSSVLILSLDDIGVQNNQCDCSLDLLSGYDFILSPVFLFGLSVRLSDNRLKEGLFNAVLSAFSWGLFMNTAVGNQATHCLVIREAVLPDRRIKKNNIVFVDPKGSKFCEKFIQFE